VTRRRWLAVIGGVAVSVAGALVARSMATEFVSGVDLADLRSGIADRGAQAYLDANPEAVEPAAAPGAAPVEFEVRPGESVGSIASRLEALGVVRDARAFEALARVSGMDSRLQAGEHRLEPDSAADDVMRSLLIAQGDQVRLVLPEGLRAEEVAARLGAAGIVDADEFLRVVGEGEATLDTVPEVAAILPDGATLEGYLYPDTYDFEIPASGAAGVVERLVANFAARVPQEFQAAAHRVGLEPHEVVILASIVEREAVLESERARIARVFLNRLEEPPYLLNADPAVQYAHGYQAEDDTWWKRPLSTIDLQVDSAYNTYRVGGLPPGPIASPGAASIEAVLRPEQGDWKYFVADEIACDGSHVFSLTYEEHLANVGRVQVGGCLD